MAKGNGISSFSVLLLMAVAAVVGLAAAGSLKVQYSPAVPERSITVSFSYSGASAYIVEAEVTSVIEGALSNVASRRSVSSRSWEGGGRVSLDFGKRADMAAARFEVASVIRNLYPSLPSGVSYPDLSLNVSGGRSWTALSYDIRSSLSTKQISDFIEDRMITPLSSVEGVEWVNLSGVTPYEWVVEFDSEKVRLYGIGADDISSAFRTAFAENIAGMTQYDGKTCSVRLRTLRPEDFGDIPVCKASGRMIYIRDIARCSYQESEPDYYFRLNGLNTVNLSIGISRAANLLSVTRDVKDCMSRLEKCYPDGMSSSLGYDSSEYISKELDKIYFRTLVCLLLLLGFVFIANRSWKYMLVIAITITVNILVAAAVYWLVGLRIHIYTLAGITVSLGIIIDSSIIMTDHWSRYRNRGAFPALLCAILTTVAALLVILLLPDRERASLTDFAFVIAINLAVSLLVAYLFVPALLDYIHLDVHSGKTPVRRLRRIIRWNRRYEGYIRRGLRYRWAYLVALVLAFGIPTVLLPDKVGSDKEEEQKWYEKVYNHIFGSGFYADNRAVIDKVLGTSFAMFHEAMDRSDFYREPSRQVLSIRAGMPEGCSVSQLDEIVRDMENYIAQYSDMIEYFTTQIYSHSDASISVYFKPEYENTGFPAKLKADVTSMAINLGGANWSIYGITDSYFNNNVVSGYKSGRITLNGYNYNDLLGYADMLLEHIRGNRRVSAPEIWGAGFDSRPLTEYHVDYDFPSLAALGVNPYSYYSVLYSPLYDSNIGSILQDGEYADVRLVSSEKDGFDLWHILNTAIPVDSTSVKLSQIGDISARRSGLAISRNNQSYEVNVVYDFIGSYELGKRFTEEALEYMNEEVLPLGYKASAPGYGWFDAHRDTYAGLIGLVVLLVFVICSIFFESFRLPFSVILMVPVSFIGLFLTFGLSGITFDQGGFAAFVMLAGVSINAGIYLVYEYLRFSVKERREIPGKALNGMSPMAVQGLRRYADASIRNYVKAFNVKVVPIMLTIVSTVLGLIPFLFDGPDEVFWFNFAAGTIGGLVFSIIAFVLYLPVFCIKSSYFVNKNPYFGKIA